jgi:fructokinase
VDTVGAGDAFAAALVAGMLAGFDLDRINDHANRVASFVCSRPGATPVLPSDLRKEISG